MQKNTSQNLTFSLIKALVFAIGIVIFSWFMYTVISVVLLFLLAVVSAVIINAPVTWLEKKRIPRPWAALLIILLIYIVLGLLTWLIFPVVSTQLKSLIANLPVYAEKIEKMFSAWKAEYFQWIDQPVQESEVTSHLPDLTNTLWKLGGYSISLLESLVLFMVFGSLTAYMVIYPRPLLEFYLSLFPLRLKDKSERAFVKTSSMLIGWMRANLIGGVIQGISVVVFLSLMNVPGAWVWGALAFISQMIPRVGFYLMSIPPTLVAFSISPLTALWVFIFFIVLDEIIGDFVMPKIRSSSMNLHPVAIIFILLIMGSAFGFTGILLSTPVAAFLKAYYEEFYLSRLSSDDKMEQRIDSMIQISKPKKVT